MSDLRSVARGEDIFLSAIFVEIDGDHANPVADTLRLSIYPPGCDPRQGDYDDVAWVLNATLTSGGTGTYANPGRLVENPEPGKFVYRFTVPENETLGAAFDRWQGELEFEHLDATFTWAIVGGSAIQPGAARLYDNNKIYVELDSTLEAEDGTTLGSDYLFYFTTTYNPLYTSVDRVKLDLGSLVGDIPDDTINLAIFEASIQADALTFLPAPLEEKPRQYFEFARRQFVTCAAELLLMDEIERQRSTAGKTKTLADLTVNLGGSTVRTQSTLDRLQSCQERWRDALTSGGQLGPGTSLQPSMVIKGIYDPDRPPIGRSWESTHCSGDAQIPAANVRKLSRYSLRWKRGFRSSLWHSRFDID